MLLKGKNMILLTIKLIIIDKKLIALFQRSVMIVNNAVNFKFNYFLLTFIINESKFVLDNFSLSIILLVFYRFYEKLGLKKIQFSTLVFSFFRLEGLFGAVSTDFPVLGLAESFNSMLLAL